MKKFFTIFLVSVFFITACADPVPDPAPSQPDRKIFEWKMALTWPKTLQGLGTEAVKLVEDIEVMSGGRLKITIYGAGELFPALALFEQVKAGTVEMGHSSAYYWVAQEPAAQFFSTWPFGLLPQEIFAWLYAAGGLDLWQSLYAKHGLVVFPAGNTGAQMGGWFQKEITELADFQGLKMRIPGLASNAIVDAGGSAENLPAGELYQALEQGTLDALEWVGPYNDVIMGFNQVADYYYSPGWHEPGTVLELMINQDAWNELPPDLQKIIEIAAQAASLRIFAEYEARNAEYLAKIQAENRVQFREFPEDVLQAFRQSMEAALQEKAQVNPEFRRIFESAQKFQKLIRQWTNISEKSFLKTCRKPAN